MYIWKWYTAYYILTITIMTNHDTDHSWSKGETIESSGMSNIFDMVWNGFLWAVGIALFVFMIYLYNTSGDDTKAGAEQQTYKSVDY